MKKLALLSALALGLVINAQAQEQKQRPKNKKTEITPEKIAENKTERLAKLLDLTDKQKEQVYSLQLKQSKEQLAEMQKMKEKRNKEKTELEAILDNTQKEKLQEAFKDRARFAQRKFQGKHNKKDRMPGKTKDLKPTENEIDS
ncbi:hypothetical protein [Olivibacter sitiensis]|uniref:hypothetical protein n=1 Tax=Olivibacter sitiensis TaxID=376470 RepID=UPI000427E079|nr:hypothetical protein [Olivibacter sitiensis]